MNKHKNKKGGLKLPQVSHTKGYYRFSADFPSVTDSNGYRNNDIIINSPEKKAAVRRKITLFSVLSFLIAFIVTSLCFAVSNVPLKAEESSKLDSSRADTVFDGNKSAFVSGDVLSYRSAESVISSLLVSGVKTAVIDFKDAFGYLYFKPSVAVTAEAVSKASEDPSGIIKEFKDAGITVVARISCFADDIYARSHKNDTAYVLSALQSGGTEQEKSIWYGSEYGEKHSWLSPYSNEVLFYLNTITSDIEKLGVDGIILENAVIPLSAKKENVFFSHSEGSDAQPDAKTAAWVAYASEHLSCKTGLAVSANQLAEAARQSGEELIISQAASFVVLDIRTQAAEKGIIIKNKQYLDPEKTPTEFTAAILSLCSEFLSENEIDADILPVIENTERTDTVINSTAQLNDSKIKSYIIETAE